MPFVDLFVCVLQCSMNFGAQDVELKEKVSKVCRLLVNMHLRKFWKYFIGTLLGELSYAVFSAVKTDRYETIWLPPSHPYFRSRVLFILFKTLLDPKQILTWYRLLIFRASLPKQMKTQSQLLKAVCICPVRFLSPKKAMARCFLV